MSHFNLRVYGLLFNLRDEVLVSIELRKGLHMIKFPGGGLEWGEGLSETLRREWKEELNLAIQVDDLFYVNDFFQPSQFNPKDQLFSFYYRLSCAEWLEIPTVGKDFDMLEEGERVTWVKLKDLDQIKFTFPIDRLVAKRIVDTVKNQ